MCPTYPEDIPMACLITLLATSYLSTLSTCEHEASYEYNMSGAVLGPFGIEKREK
jgi:hypothetical protein